MNVMIEGEPAVRHLDLVTHNHTGPQPPNTPPMPWLSTMNVPAPPLESSGQDQAKGLDFVRFSFVDDKDKPLLHIRVTLTLPDGSSLDSPLAGGATSVLGISKGNCASVCTDFREKARRRARKRKDGQGSPPPASSPPPGKEIKTTRKDLSSSGVTFATGDTYKIVAPPVPAPLVLTLVSTGERRHSRGQI